MICWLIPGNPYPVTEHPKKEKKESSSTSTGNTDPVREKPKMKESSLCGKALFPGYQSHYVLTNVKGFPIKSIKSKNTIFDEIVIEQEQQVVPAFIISPQKKHLKDLLKKFDREVVEVERAEREGEPTNKFHIV
eukprot:TRINITY_DN3250_c0_g6_i1.p1 TRINITY_DN3250_c0_g6~~TRINITY_DN3250_c0_g6_i1.p1  ORF type:complete len:134 (-),score=35.45 TRINITY_DN3250_c0_g6_i1:29-430(-)